MLPTLLQTLFIVSLMFGFLKVLSTNATISPLFYLFIACLLDYNVASIKAWPLSMMLTTLASALRTVSNNKVILCPQRTDSPVNYKICTKVVLVNGVFKSF